MSKPFRPREVEVDPKVVEQILKEEDELEMRKINEILKKIHD
jgi:hypothetical protein